MKPSIYSLTPDMIDWAGERRKKFRAANHRMALSETRPVEEMTNLSKGLDYWIK